LRLVSFSKVSSNLEAVLILENSLLIITRNNSPWIDLKFLYKFNAKLRLLRYLNILIRWKSTLGFATWWIFSKEYMRLLKTLKIIVKVLKINWKLKEFRMNKSSITLLQETRLPSNNFTKFLELIFWDK
jgi:hypothetical protein